MPELPEVEAVRAGLARHVTGLRVQDVEVRDPRPLRRQVGGPAAFREELVGRTVTAVVRRGKFLWLPLDDGRALSAHLGMSGQMLVRSGERSNGDGTRESDYLGDPADAVVDLTATRAPSLVRDLSTSPRHLRVRIRLSGGGSHGAGARGTDTAGGPVFLDLVDQRMLGGLHLTDLVPTADGAPGGAGSPAPLMPADATHIARDLLDPALDLDAVVERIRASRRAVKTILLDQGVVSGIGNIYADEGLWAARVHGRRPGTAMGPRVTPRLLSATAEVMRRALAVGGTSFDSLYVDADGAPGYFARSLEVYGRAGQECRRCGTVLRTEVLAARSHTFCPHCQRIR